MPPKKKLLVAVAIAAVSATAQADILAQWVPTGGDAASSDYNNSGQTPAPTVVGAGVSASVADRVNQPVIGNAGAVWPGYIANNGGTAGTYDPETGGYTTFTISPLAGSNITFTTITYALHSYGGMNDAGGYTGVVRTSADSFASELATQTITSASAGTFSFDVCYGCLFGKGQSDVFSITRGE